LKIKNQKNVIANEVKQSKMDRHVESNSTRDDKC